MIRFDFIQDDGTFMVDYVHGGQVSGIVFGSGFGTKNMPRELLIQEDRLEMTDTFENLDLGMTGMNSDLNFYVAGGGATRRLEHVLDFTNRLFYSENPASALVPLDVARLYVTPSSKLPTATGFWSAPDGTISYPASHGRVSVFNAMMK